MRAIKLFESFQTEDEIKEICRRYDIEDYSINKDMSIDVHQNAIFKHESLTEIPLTFNRVIGDFRCYSNRLTSLKGSPRSCREFSCGDNNLTSLKGAPEYCDKFFCYGNKELKTLEFISRTPYVDIEDTKVASLRYLPNICTVCRNNILEYLLSLIGEYKGYGGNYRVTNIDLFNVYEVIDDIDYIKGVDEKPSISIDKLRHFLEDVEIDKEINVYKLSKYYNII